MFVCFGFGNIIKDQMTSINVTGGNVCHVAVVALVDRLSDL